MSMRLICSLALLALLLVACREEQPRTPQSVPYEGQMVPLTLHVSIGEPDVILLPEEKKELLEVKWQAEDRVYLYALHGSRLEILPAVSPKEISTDGREACLELSYPLYQGEETTLVGSLAPLVLKEGRLVAEASPIFRSLAVCQRSHRSFVLKGLSSTRSAKAEPRKVTLKSSGRLLLMDLANGSKEPMEGELRLVGLPMRDYVYAEGLATVSSRAAGGEASHTHTIRLAPKEEARLALWVGTTQGTEEAALSVLYHAAADGDKPMTLAQIDLKKDLSKTPEASCLTLPAYRWTGQGFRYNGNAKLPQITLVTGKVIGQPILIDAEVEPEDRKDAWIDLNNNSMRDEGEDLIFDAEDKAYTLLSQTVTLYGKIRSLRVVGQLLTELYVSGAPYLTRLDCSDNKLCQLDLEKNPLLTHLDAHKNALTAISLAKNTELIELALNRNQLKEVSLTTLSKLEDLQVDYNHLSTLDLSGNAELKRLSCDGNSLTTLSLDKQAKLRQLYCKDNKLAELSLASCPQLMDLSCSSNILESIDLSHCPKLQSFDCSYNRLTDMGELNTPDIYSVNCSNNQIAELSLLGCSKLSVLNCAHNKLTSIDLSKCSALSSLDCSSNQIGHLEFLHHPSLSTLICDHNALRTIDLSGVGRGLTALNCDHNELTGFKGLGRLLNLSEISCQYNKFTTLDLTEAGNLTRIICSNNSTLSKIIFSANTRRMDLIRCDHCAIKVLDLSTLRMIDSVEASHNKIVSVMLSNLCRALVNLDIRNNLMSASALESLFRSLPVADEDRGGNILITTNPGTDECDISMAESKFWYVGTEW